MLCKMKTLILSAALFFTLPTEGWSELPPDQMIKTLTAVIREYCPEASIETGNNLFTAKYGTMMFTLHGKSMTGEISAGTYQEEGPNFKGFVLKISMEKGPYTAQAVIPQELHGPYYPTFIDGPPTEDGTNHYWIVFSYGSRLDPKLKQAIFDALPKSRSRPSNPRDATSPSLDRRK